VLLVVLGCLSMVYWGWLVECRIFGLRIARVRGSNLRCFHLFSIALANVAGSTKKAQASSEG